MHHQSCCIETRNGTQYIDGHESMTFDQNGSSAPVAYFRGGSLYYAPSCILPIFGRILDGLP